MHICVVGQDGSIFYTNEENNPWTHFFRAAEFKEHTFSTDLNCTEIDALICMGFHSEKVIPLLTRVSSNYSVLVNWEPDVVEPETYNPAYFTHFGKRFSPSIEWARKLDSEAFPWPQRELNDIEPFEVWKLREHRAVIVQANKFSAHRNAQYKLRRKLIWKLGNKGTLILYGQDWEQSPFLNLRLWFSSFRRLSYKNISLYIGGISRPSRKFYRGSANNKIEEMGQFQISVVIENSRDYVSEKLIESVSANCLTIYVGTNLEQYGMKITDLLLPKPTYREISECLTHLLSLSSEERYHLLKKQREAMIAYCSYSNNSEVLSKLAKDSLNFFDSAKC